MEAYIQSETSGDAFTVAKSGRFILTGYSRALTHTQDEQNLLDFHVRNTIPFMRKLEQSGVFLTKD